jgi:uncharacterized protein YjbJ (UPF0337 family)
MYDLQTMSGFGSPTMAALKTANWRSSSELAEPGNRRGPTAVALVGPDSLFMKSSTKDKIQGGINEAKGKAKEETGKIIGNPNLRDRGTAEKAGGKIQRKVGDVKKVFGQ